MGFTEVLTEFGGLSVADLPPEPVTPLPVPHGFAAAEVAWRIDVFDAARRPHLERLDLSHHDISAEMQDRLRTAWPGVDVDLSDLRPNTKGAATQRWQSDHGLLRAPQ